MPQNQTPLDPFRTGDSKIEEVEPTPRDVLPALAEFAQLYSQAVSTATAMATLQALRNNIVSQGWITEQAEMIYDSSIAHAFGTLIRLRVLEA